MKKYLISLMAVFMGCMPAMAGVKIVSGDRTFFKTAEGNAVMTFIWDGATYDDREPLSTHYTNLEALKSVAWHGFAETFNERSKKLKVVKDEASAKYRFTMKVTKMDSYIKVMGFIPSPATKAWGTFTVTDIATGETILTADVVEVDGGANPSPDGTFSDCFEDLAKKVVKLKK